MEQNIFIMNPLRTITRIQAMLVGQIANTQTPLFSYLSDGKVNNDCRERTDNRKKI